MSNPDVSGRSATTRDEIFTVLADGTRREALRIAAERAPVAKDDLAYELAAVMADKPLADVTDEEYRRARVACRHRTLPALFDAGLLTETDDEITTTDHPAFEDSELEPVLEGRTDADADELDAVFGALSDSRRRTILSILGEQYHALSTETLARDVAATEAGTTEREVSTEHVEEVLTSLVHVHLPRLADAGLIGYDAEDERVSYEGHPVLRTAWLESGDRDRSESTAEETGSSESDVAESVVRTRRGRESVIATGQSLLERADDELVVMITTTGLLEEGCFRRIEDAVDRGVDVAVGSPDPRVRELVGERVPEVDVWEPRLDWLDLASTGETLGRVVVADREGAMLATLEGTDTDGEYGETAIVGEGLENGLVVFLRRLLRSRLDATSDCEASVPSELPL